MKAATHDGHFHADEAFASAILKLAVPDVEIVRTRDPQVLKAADIRFDVGHAYDASTGDFDHHQERGAGERENKVPYAAVGLIWKHFGERLCEDDDAWEYIDRKLIQPIDAGDNGLTTYEKSIVDPYKIHDVIEIFNPDWQDPDADFDIEFSKAVNFAMEILSRELRKANGITKAAKIVRQAIEDSPDDFIVLDQYCPWEKVVVEESDAKFLIHPAGSGWYIYTVPLEPGSFKRRKLFPVDWGGMQGEEFELFTGVEGATFCHKDLFIAGAKTKEAALQIVKLALE